MELTLFITEMFLSFAFFVNLGLGILVYFKAIPPRRVNFIFSILAWAAAGWALSFFMVYLFEDNPSKLFWGRMGFATLGVIPAAFLTFALLFPQDRRRMSSYKLILLGSPRHPLFWLVFYYPDRLIPWFRSKDVCLWPLLFPLLHLFDRLYYFRFPFLNKNL